MKSMMPIVVLNKSNRRDLPGNAWMQMLGQIFLTNCLPRWIWVNYNWPALSLFLGLHYARPIHQLFFNKLPLSKLSARSYQQYLWITRFCAIIWFSRGQEMARCVAHDMGRRLQKSYFGGCRGTGDHEDIN